MAQKLEGASGLSRPFGYYGSVVGGIGGAVVAGVVSGNVMLLLAAIAIEAPWMQAIGRLRCLVQGCCHGSGAPAYVGIRYRQPRSRVCQLAGLKGAPLHPTPLYSIVCNVVIGLLLLRFWSLGAPAAVIAGSYLILAGVTRFAEESYRGEPQTPIAAGLRIYQWAAVVSVLAGAALTAVPSGATPDLRVASDAAVVAGALGFGLMAGVAMGVDFPRSNRRLARLAS